MTTASTALTQPLPGITSARRDARWVWLMVILAAMVVVPRTWLISRAHSACWDDQYHLVRGLAFLRGEKDLPLLYNDPPLGEALLALPMWVTGCKPSHTASTYTPTTLAPDLDNVLIGQPLSPDAILELVALWKALLFLPAVAVAFVWCRQLYGTASGWLAAGMIVFDPTIAANIAPAAPDMLGMEGALIACWLGWRYFAQPNPRRMFWAGVACAAAMLMKHTCVVLPIVFALYAWAAGSTPAPGSRKTPSPWRLRLNQLAGVLLIDVAWIWILTFFDVSQPKRVTMLMSGTYSEHWGLVSDVINPLLSHRWPGGIYIGSLFQALWHGREGHPAMLWGHVSNAGWWYYIPVLATYKAPIGYSMVALLAVLSLMWRKPARGEWGLVIPAAVLLAFVMAGRISIGFRHALPAYVFMLMLASRAATRFVPTALAWIATVAAGIHAMAFHPDYIAFVNWPRHDLYRQISDSNIDWGQGLKQVRAWLNAHPQIKRVYVAPFADPYSRLPVYYLGPGVTLLRESDAPPKSGLLIISPVRLAGAYDPGEPYRFLWSVRPITVIGHTMRVYDLDARASSGESSRR